MRASKPAKRAKPAAKRAKPATIKRAKPPAKRAKPAAKPAKRAPKRAASSPALSAVARLYRGQTPAVVDGDPPTLVFRGSAPDHWHLISDGIRNSFEDPAKGTELTFRVPRGPSEQAPPEWAIRFFRKVTAHFLYASSGFFEGHHLEITGAVDGLPYAIGVRDPGLHRPGGVEFVQLVGVTADELAAIMDWDCRKFARILLQANPTGLTEQGRASVLDVPARRAEIAAATARDGASMDSVYVSDLAWAATDGRIQIKLTEQARGALQRMLRGRSLHQRAFFVSSFHDGATLYVDPAPAPGFEIVDGAPHLKVDATSAQRMIADLAEARTRYAWPGVELEFAS